MFNIFAKITNWNNNNNNNVLTQSEGVWIVEQGKGEDVQKRDCVPQGTLVKT